MVLRRRSSTGHDVEQTTERRIQVAVGFVAANASNGSCGLVAADDAKRAVATRRLVALSSGLRFRFADIVPASKRTDCRWPRHCHALVRIYHDLFAAGSSLEPRACDSRNSLTRDSGRRVGIAIAAS